MTKPTRDQLKDLLRDSHQRDRRDPTERAKGLDALLAAADAPAPIPPPPSSGKKLAVGAAVAVTAVGLAVWWLRPVPPPVPEVVDAGVVQMVVMAPVDAGVEEEDAGSVVEAVDASVVAVVQPPAVRPRVKEPEEEEETPDSLARELTLLDTARKQLGTPSAALSTLDTYGKEFPKGSMRTEAALVRLEVLMKLNRRAEAEKLARSLIAADRDGLVKRRVSKLLDAGVP
ncbi:MAG: hypothetical protein ABTQ32_07275 [Myxococcaceae bacterium]